MDKITYEPISENFPSEYTVDDLRRLYMKLRPLFTEDDRTEKVIQIENN